MLAKMRGNSHPQSPVFVHSGDGESFSRSLSHVFDYGAVSLLVSSSLQRMKVCWSSFILGLVVGVGASIYVSCVCVEGVRSMTTYIK
eukprot:scaffold19398_cov76-Skeletonema_dohrnii-CCMP3373.AAC.2